MASDILLLNALKSKLMFVSWLVSQEGGSGVPNGNGPPTLSDLLSLTLGMREGMNCGGDFQTKKRSGVTFMRLLLV